MKVFYLDDIPTPYRLGVFKRIASTLGNNFKVGFCADNEPGRNWNLDFSGFNYEILKGFQWRPPLQLNPFSFKINISVINVLRKFSPDIVIVSGYIHPTVYLAVLYCRIKNIPYAVVSETNEHCSATSGIKWFIKKILVSPIVKYMTFGLPCGSQAEMYFKLLGVKENTPYFYFPNTPDVSPIKKVSLSIKQKGRSEFLKTKYSIDEKKVSILFVGRLIEAKNPLELISAFKLMKLSEKNRVNLIIVGAGSLEDIIKEKVYDHENIHLVPWLSDPDDVYGLMCASDIFVLPSTHEPWGAVVNEAMAAGCCVIVSHRVGAAYDLIENEVSGFTYTSGDSVTLSKTIQRLINDKELRLRISHEAEKSADKYSQEFAASNLLKGLMHVSKNV